MAKKKSKPKSAAAAKLGKARWAAISKKDRSAEMKRIRAQAGPVDPAKAKERAKKAAAARWGKKKS
jgi:hypothetical protein